jgi:hypothetical protein
MAALFVAGGLAAQDDSLYQGRIKSKMALLAFDNQSALWFTDAESGRAIAGAQVTIAGTTLTTDSDGLAIFNSPPDGKYKITMEKRGYVVLNSQFEVIFGQILFNKFSVPKAGSPKNVKIVLDWGETPDDLDLHLVKEGGYHISYRDKIKADDGTAWLDRDDTDGYGPETITISKLDPDAVYTLFVRDFTNRGRRRSRALGNSAAVVRVYLDNRLNKTFTVAAGMTGDIWNVFTIEHGVIHPANTDE